MKIMNTTFRALLLAAACSSGSALAQNITISNVDYDPPAQVIGTFTDGYFNSNYAPNHVEDYASGVMNVEAYNTQDVSQTKFNFPAFCVEPVVDFDLQNPVTLVYQGALLSGIPNYIQVEKIIGGYLNYAASIVDPDDQSLEAAAAQWAIWEVVAETLSSGYSVSEGDGNVYIMPGDFPTIPDHSVFDTAVIGRANFYLANINTFAPAQNLVYLTSAGNQDIITWNIPEPGTAGLLAFSVLGLLRRRR